jgi:predicted nucleotidyltransferase
MMKRKLQIDVPRKQIVDFCKKHHIRKLSLFGSVLRDDFRPDSDIDVLVEFEPEQVIGFFKLFDMEEELSKILGGRKVEMNTPHSLSRYFRSHVMKSAEVQYAQ